MSATGRVFQFMAGEISLDFINTLDDRPTDHPKELLVDYDEFIAWAEQGGAITAKHAQALRKLAANNPGDAFTYLHRAIYLRESLNIIFEALVEERPIPEQHLGLFNRDLRQAMKNAEVVREGDKFVWHWRDPEASLESVMWVIVRSAAELLTSDDLQYVRYCAAEDCRWFFVDRTKNHGRRWCEMRVCGNRDKARRHYQRSKHPAKPVRASKRGA